MLRRATHPRLICVIVSCIAACGDDDAGGSDGATDTGAATETAVTETAVTETSVTETAVTETAVTETIEDATVTETAETIEPTEVVQDTSPPSVCLGRTADRAEGLYQGDALVAACDPDERCNVAGDTCVAARCFPAATGFAEGVYELDGEARGARIERCETGYRCDDDGTPYCERVPGVGTPVGFACEDDLDCAGIDGFEGRCLDAPGGYPMNDGRCGHGCGAQGDCPSGSHCAFLGTDDPVCVADCPAFTPCPTEAFCQDADADGRDECIPSGALPTDVGAACTSVEDCAGKAPQTLCVLDGDVYWTNGYCAQLGCVIDQDCPAGSHCGYYGSSPGGGACIADCGAGGTCARPELGCSDADLDGRRECVPQGHGEGAVGAPCTRIGQCGGGPDARCWSEVESGIVGGHCTVLCTGDDDCPGGSICQGRGGNGVGLCMTACDGAGDCPDNQVCFDRDFDDRGECGRRGAGALAQNAACTATAACGTGPQAVCHGGANFAAICSADCLSDAECGAASHCVMLEGRGQGFCLPDCTVGGAACPANSGCVDFDVDGRTECGPAAFGALAIGERCAAASDCAAGDGIFCAYPDLVCSRFCTDDAACGTGNRCINLGNDANRTCRKGCTADAQCADGLSCVDIDASGQKECIAVGFGQGPVGAACGGRESCLAGADLVCWGEYPGGMCSRGCSAGVACPAGSHCGDAPEGGPDVCFADCTTSADCREADGWACFDGDGNGSKECRPFGGGDGEVGAVCKTAVDCGGGEAARCVTTAATFAGACSRSCETSGVCGEGGQCVAIPGQASSICLAGCASDDDCRELYTCSDVGGAAATECAYTCGDDDDCRGFRGAPTCNADGLCGP